MLLGKTPKPKPRIENPASFATRGSRKCWSGSTRLGKTITKLTGTYNSDSSSFEAFWVKFQIQFEKIREADHQVRWQHEEDIEECSNCHIPFSNSKRKQHCRHCGQIFCPNCVSRVVQSGPNMRPSHVCDVCYTLLVKSSAPYFSKELPTTWIGRL